MTLELLLLLIDGIFNDLLEQDAVSDDQVDGWLALTERADALFAH